MWSIFVIAGFCHRCIKAGAAFRVQAANRQNDGSFTTSTINVGRDGARPF